MESKINIEDGKYTLMHDNGSNFRCLRYGEPWRDLTGDKMILCLMQRIEYLEDKFNQLLFCDGSIANVASAEILAKRIQIFAKEALENKR